VRPVNGRFDAGLYRWVTDLAQHSPDRVDDTVHVFSDYGLGIFAVLMLLAWWQARSAPPQRMAAALGAPLVVAAVYLVNDLVKSLIAEQRPCHALHVVTLEACPSVTDYSFPSNHSAIAAAATVALLLADRRIGRYALPLALLMAASRVWIGVHYPHDVLVGLAAGTLLATPLALATRRAAPLVTHLRATPLRPLLAHQSQGQSQRQSQTT
jgi:undecaprenyl-diphosphatase